ncbi:MAG: hypothetical protein KGI54_06105 [Pseudomonadota bacterium]|nr:hypothetical protein [Pseudomonadota bacterium]
MPQLKCVTKKTGLGRVFNRKWRRDGPSGTSSQNEGDAGTGKPSLSFATPGLQVKID